jgi:hypothetical protein
MAAADQVLATLLLGGRVKHRVKRNWIRMYNKEGSVLRVETVINQPDSSRSVGVCAVREGTSWPGCP